MLLPAHLSPLAAFLDDGDIPHVQTLQRVYDVSPLYRLTKLPGLLDRVMTLASGAARTIRGRPAYVKVWEQRPTSAHDQLRRAAGYARKQRLLAWSAERQGRVEDWPARMEYCDAMINGLWFVGAWPMVAVVTKNKHGIVTQIEFPFASAQMFQQLGQGELAVRAAMAKAAKDAALDGTADEETLLELEENPTLRAQMSDIYRQGAKEDWHVVMRGAHSVDFGRLLGGSNGGKDRESVAGSGQGVQPGRVEEAAGGMGQDGDPGQPG